MKFLLTIAGAVIGCASTELHGISQADPEVINTAPKSVIVKPGPELTCFCALAAR